MNCSWVNPTQKPSRGTEANSEYALGPWPVDRLLERGETRSKVGEDHVGMPGVPMMWAAVVLWEFGPVVSVEMFS